MNEATIQLPRQMSTIAENVDNMYYFIFWVSVFFFVAIIGISLWCIVKYRASRHPHALPPGHHDVLELFWTFAPLLLLIPMFHFGFKGYVRAMVAPDDSIEIRVRGKQWAWDFYYPGDTEPSPSEMVVPVSRPVKMLMSSQDVLHSFYVPEFRVKRDVVPGMYSSVWFEALEITSKYDETANKVTGEPLDLFCAEYCGTSHSQMLAKVHVVSDKDYAAFIAGKDRAPEGKPLAEVGAELYKKNACNTCHTVDGSPLVGPSFKGLFGKTEQTSAGAVKVDENYLRESILKPQEKIVNGYAGKNMPAFVLKDWKLDALIEYIKSLK
jgi:cytochrome c oxidase subunit 2